MNILYINHYAGSPEMGMEFRPYYLAREWVKMGHNVTMIAASFSHLRRINPKPTKDFEIEEIDGIKYMWVLTDTYSGNGLARAKTMYQFVHKLRKKAKCLIESENPDVVITSSTYPLDTYAGQRLKKIKNDIVLIHEVHDMWPSTLTMIGGMPKAHPFVVAMQIGENSAYRNSDYVVSLPPTAEPYMKKHGLGENKFVHLSNGIALEEWESEERIPGKHRAVLEEIRQGGRKIIGYAGGHALSNDLDKILKTARLMKNEKACFVLVGDGVEKPALVKHAMDLELDNVIFLDPISKKQVPDLLRQFDFGIVVAKESPLYREFGVCMNKIFDYLAAGIPQIIAINTDGTPLDGTKAGVHIKTDEPAELEKTIRQLIALDDKELKEMGEEARKLSHEKYTYKALAQDFAKLFSK